MLTYVSKKLSLVSEERGKVFRLGVKIVTNVTFQTSPEKIQSICPRTVANPYRRSLYQLIVIKYKVKCIKVVDYKVRRWYNGFTEIRKGANES